MRSKASYFSISMPLIKENLRKFWALPVLAFLVYFLSGVFPILMSYKNLGYMASYIETSLHNLQPFFMGAHLFVPVIAAMLLYRYLQNVGSVAVMHSMPFTRSKLFNSGIITGAIMISVPILMNGVILLLLSKPTYRQWGYGENLTISTQNVFSAGEVLNWMGTSLLIVLVLFSVAVFTAIVTGNNLMHLLTSYFFIFLIPLLYAVFNFYFQEFLYGFDLSGNWMDICLAISPYTGILNSGGYFGATAVGYYIGTIILMAVVSAILYNKRKLERASDSLTFLFMKPIICYIIAFLGMTMLGFYFQVLGEGRNYMYAGFAAGTVIFFIIGQMIVNKSARIFNKDGLKFFLAYCLIAIVFIVGLNVDATGFERRVPSPEKLNGADITMPFNRTIFTGFTGGDFTEEQILTSPENLEALTAFHQSIIDNRSRFELPQENTYTTNLRIMYDNKGLLDMNRRYIVDYRFWAESAQLKKIFESAEYKTKNSLYRIKTDAFTRAYFYSDLGTNEREITDSRLLDELVACLEKDLMAMSYEDITSLKPGYVNIELQYNLIGKAAGMYDGAKGHMSFNVPKSAAHTIQWLKDHGYSFDLTADMVEQIDIYPSKHGDNEKTIENYRDMVTKDPQSTYSDRTPLMRITDKDKIGKILESYDVSPINYDEAYEISIKVRTHEFGDEYKEVLGEYSYIPGYLNQTLDFIN